MDHHPLTHNLQSVVRHNATSAIRRRRALISGSIPPGPRFAPLRGAMPGPKHYVYILQSLADRDRYYTGVTNDPRSRLAAHNAGRSPHTQKGRPWELDVLIEFADESRALAFEALPEIRLRRRVREAAPAVRVTSRRQPGRQR